MDCTYRLSEISVAINSILNGDGTFDSSQRYKLVKQEKYDEDDYLPKDDDR